MSGILRVGAGILFVLALVALGSWFWVQSQEGGVAGDPPPAPLALLWAPIPDGPQATLLRRGREVAIEGDCVSCHTRSNGPPFAGGLGLKTPFGLIYSANLTSDRRTGIGGWTDAQFFEALNRGASPDRGHLYPAFPYTHFTSIPRADTDALLAWLKTVPPARYSPPGNLLPFPFDIRLGMIGWNALFFQPHGFHPEPGQSATWNRGAYLVNGPGHCAACHSPKNLAGADETDKAFQGGELNQWVAPNLTGDARTGLGGWSVADIVEYLRTGRNEHSNAAGPMAEVVSYSTSLMPDADLTAIATYLKSLPPRVTAPPAAPPDPATMRRGGAVYSDACASCHLADGKGQARFFPPLPGSAVAQQADPTGMVHIILGGARTGPTLSRPSALTMPSFAWKLTDQAVADVASYVRASWGNRAAPVERGKVSGLRKSLRLTSALAGR